MKWFLVGLSFLLLKSQDLPKQQENQRINQKIIAEIPDFYFFHYEHGYLPHYLKLFNAAPQNVKRSYFLKLVNSVGNVNNDCREINEEEFYKLSAYLLGYGVYDKNEWSRYLNEGYQSFLKTLLQYEIVSGDALRQFSALYKGRGWVESIYFLDEAVPGLVTDEEWKEELKKQVLDEANPHSHYFYFGVLVRIKNKQPLDEVREYLDNRLLKNEIYPGSNFQNLSKAYAELARKGVEIPEDMQIKLFSSFMDSNPNFDLHMIGTYKLIGLPMPNKKIIEKTLVSNIKITEENALQKALTKFRNLGIEWPKEYAATCRDVLLKNFGNFEDILYLIKLAEQDAKPELWKKYADRALHWYDCKENRKLYNDTGDYYHYAIEGYKRAFKGGIKLSWDKTDKLKEVFEDLSVHTKDLITAYELAEYKPKESRWIIEKLDGRIEQLNSVATGIVYNEHGETIWLTNEYGQKLLPLQEEIELAAYLDLNDPERIRNLADKISCYEIEKLKKEAPELAKQAAKLYKRPRNGLDWLTVMYNRIIFQSAMRRLDTPVYLEISAIMDLYENLGFKVGARSLAQYLMEVGFIVPARRAFHLGGLGKEAEEQFYSKHDDAYWKNQQADCSGEIRKKAIRRPADKN